MKKIEHIIFWALIIAAIGVAIWIQFGSPTTEQSLLMVAIFISTSGILLWKSLFKIDKKTAIGFEKVKSQFNKIDNNFKNININLNEIKSLIRK